MVVLSDVFWLLLAAVLLWALWQHLNISQRAFAAARQRCAEAGVNLLDESVVLQRIRLHWNKRLGPQLLRRYHFEFSTLGDTRYEGEIIFAGRHLITLEMEAFRAPESHDFRLN